VVRDQVCAGVAEREGDVAVSESTRQLEDREIPRKTRVPVAACFGVQELVCESYESRSPPAPVPVPR